MFLQTSDETDAKVVAGAVPLVGGIAAAAIGVGFLKACCGVKYSKVDPKGLLPTAMAAATAGVAIWAYFNPEAVYDRDKK
jgi:hypothetical protein